MNWEVLGMRSSGVAVVDVDGQLCEHRVTHRSASSTKTNLHARPGGVTPPLGAIRCHFLLFMSKVCVVARKSKPSAQPPDEERTVCNAVSMSRQQQAASEHVCGLTKQEDFASNACQTAP